MWESLTIAPQQWSEWCRITTFTHPHGFSILPITATVEKFTILAQTRISTYTIHVSSPTGYSVDICSSSTSPRAAGKYLLHHGLLHSLRVDLISGTYSTSPPPSLLIPVSAGLFLTVIYLTFHGLAVFWPLLNLFFQWCFYLGQAGWSWPRAALIFLTEVPGSCFSFFLVIFCGFFTLTCFFINCKGFSP